MSTAILYELVGYLASGLVVLSLTMARLLWLRVINLLGSATFLLYGILIDAPPIVVTNVIVLGINLVYLWRMTRTRAWYQLLEVGADSDYLRCFLDFYEEKIRLFQPGFAYRPAPGQLRLFVLRDMVPAGLFIADPGEDGRYDVRLDFVIPGHRDYRIGRYLFRDRLAFFRERGIRVLESEAGAPRHAAYLERMGFRPVGEGAPGRYRRELA